MKGNLVWKLLRRHVSVAQLGGFFFANLIGMTIVLLAYQFYRDVVPMFTAEDGLLKSDFVVVSTISFDLIISLLSLYILMLSIYLLVEKNAEKLQNLLLIGYRPSQVARPYQLLTIALNAVVSVLSVLVVCLVRNYYIRIVDSLFPTASSSTLWPAIALGTLLFSIVTAVNLLVIQKKIQSSI